MTCRKVNFGGTVAYISVADEYRIRSGGKEFRFEFHPYCGPAIIGKRGNPLAALPPQNSPFWDALHFWLKQGKQVDADGWCVFKAEMKLVNILKPMGGRNYQLLG